MLETKNKTLTFYKKNIWYIQENQNINIKKIKKMENLWLLNKVEKEDNITFTVWCETGYYISLFEEKVVSIEISQKLKKQSAISKGYWVNITVPKKNFGKVIEDIKHFFKDTEINVCENFARKEWDTHTDMRN